MGDVPGAVRRLPRHRDADRHGADGVGDPPDGARAHQRGAAGQVHHDRTLSDIQAQRVAEFMGGRPLGSKDKGDAKDMANRCTSNPEMTDPTQGPNWNGWGNAGQHPLPDCRRREACVRPMCRGSS